MSESAGEKKFIYSIESIRDDDHMEVLVFLRRFFFQDSPLNKFYGNYPDQVLEDKCSRMLSRNCSFKATSDSGRILGVYINAPILPTDPIFAPSENCTESRYKKLRFLNFVAAKFDLWARYPNIENALEACVLSVDPEFRRHGIAKCLTQRTLEFAQQSGFPLVVCNCSSHYSALVCDATGFERVFQFAYNAYVADGEPSLQLESPHTHYAVYVKHFGGIDR